MTAPVWMASPPEVHSTLLSSGPGSGSLSAAAAAWDSLSAEYASLAEELIAVLASVQSGAWEGPSAESYLEAHAPYVAWLTQASAEGAGAAAQHGAVAAAYTAALAAMPTLPELATNHLLHGVLVATNFFGINTIPIALNEADYVRMWIQAATTMSTYQAISTTALAANPQTPPAPRIVSSDAPTSSPAAADPVQLIEQFMQQFTDIPVNIIKQLLQLGGMNWNPEAGAINGIPYAGYTNPLTLVFWLTRSLLYVQEFRLFQYALLTNPVGLLQGLSSLTPLQIAAYLSLHPVLAIALATSPLYSLASTGAAAAAAAAAAMLALSVPIVEIPAAAVPALAPIATVSHVLPAAGVAPTVAGSAGGGPPPAPAPAATTVSSSPPAPASAGAPFIPYAIGGGPGVGFSWNSRTGRGAGAQAEAPAPDIAAASAAAAARRRKRRRRQQDEPLRAYADEYADLPDPDDPGLPPQMHASELGAGRFGFTGTESRRSAPAAGLVVLAEDQFGGGPRIPMMPGTWHPDGERREDG